jgi:FAD/FMN-containing dehydrogenase
VRACAAAGTPIVPQGGNTGLVVGGTPDAAGTQVVMSRQRMHAVRAIDTANLTLTVEAGCVLQSVQETAREAGFLFPLSLAAEGSCTIGGNLATNAGGTQVIRYGNMRSLTLGLEVVGAHGAVWDGLRGLRKDNTGYALRDLFIGSEGTLGIITKATIQLFPLPAAQCTAMVAIASIEEALQLLKLVKKGFGPALTGFEIMSNQTLQMVEQAFTNQHIPFSNSSKTAPWFGLIELSDSESAEHGQQQFENILGQALSDNLIQDAAIANNLTQSKAFWHLRDSISLAQNQAGKSIKMDITIPISRIPEFIRQTDQILQEKFPGIVNLSFGHLGDGNIHYNVGGSDNFNDADIVNAEASVYELVHQQVFAFNGSISAEHGIGQLKNQALRQYKSPIEMQMMRAIKDTLDPQGIFNPGKIFT